MNIRKKTKEGMMKALNIVVLVIMLLQPISTPGVLYAIAEGTVDTGVAQSAKETSKKEVVEEDSVKSPEGNKKTEKEGAEKASSETKGEEGSSSDDQKITSKDEGVEVEKENADVNAGIKDVIGESDAGEKGYVKKNSSINEKCENKSDKLNGRLEAPVQTGYNVNDENDANSYSIPRPPKNKLKCAEKPENAEVTSINGISVHWTHPIENSKMVQELKDQFKYERQYNKVDSYGWTGAETYGGEHTQSDGPYTNYRTFGGDPGAEGTYGSRVRIFKDENNAYSRI